jgi:hypothetical protein
MTPGPESESRRTAESDEMVGRKRMQAYCAGRVDGAPVGGAGAGSDIGRGGNRYLAAKVGRDVVGGGGVTSGTRE